jgi:O-antigen/teichoic acid export membrane protein
MELSQIKNYIFKNVYTGLVKTAFTLILSVVAIPLIIKNIGIENYGIISIALLFSSFTGILDLGLSKSLILFQDNKKENEKEISAIYIFNLGLFGILILFSIIVFVFEINLFGKKLDVDFETLRIINSIAFLLLAFDIVNNLLRASLEANFKLQLVNWGFLIQSAIIHLSWLCLSFLKSEIIYFLFIPLVSTIISIIYHLILLPPIYTTLKRPDKSNFKNVFGVTFRFLKLGALNSMHLPLIKYSIILFIGDSRAIGIFELSTKLAVIANNMLSYISNPFFSIVSKFKNNEIDYLWKIVKKVTKFLIAVALTGYIVFFILHKFIITYFFKEYTAEIFHVLNIILISYLFIATAESIQKFMLGTGEINRVVKIKFLGIIFNLVFFFILFLSGKLNVLNISISYSLSYILIGMFWLLYSLKK